MPVAMRKLTSGRGSDRDLVYLLMLARKYGLEPIDLHNALVRAKGSKESSCGPLSIELRERRENSCRFMFSHDDRSVAQASVSETSLEKLRDVPPEIRRTGLSIRDFAGKTPRRTSRVQTTATESALPVYSG